jgi:DNA-directed RNA polymerase subunit RPC12/RpoP
LTRYYSDKHKFKQDKDTPISVRDYTNDDEDKTYYCNNCQRNLSKLIDSSGQNPSYYCNHCSIEIIPSLTEVRSKSKWDVPEGPIEHPSVSYPPEPTIGRTPVEPKGTFKMLRDRGMKIKNYKEEKGK